MRFAARGRTTGGMAGILLALPGPGGPRLWASASKAALTGSSVPSFDALGRHRRWDCGLSVSNHCV